MIIAITGASAVGKTTILKELFKSLGSERKLKVLHFDDMELPNWEEIVDIQKWQEKATLDWIDKLVDIAREEHTHILFEGSTDIKFFLEAFEQNKYEEY
ncbi:MAG: AAA family ATPase, partial [Bacteroidota bacterium]